MPNWKSRSDTEAWWSSQPGNRGKAYPGDDIAEKQYQRNKAAGENNLSFLKSLFKRSGDDSVKLGKPAKSESDYPTKDDAVSLDEPSEASVTPVRTTNTIQSNKRGGSISLKNCKVSTASKGKKNSNW